MLVNLCTLKPNRESAGQKMVQLMGYTGTLIVILSYLAATKTDQIHWMHWGNAIGGTLMVYPALATEATFSAILSGFFGVVGILGLVFRFRRGTLVVDDSVILVQVSEDFGPSSTDT